LVVTGSNPRSSGQFAKVRKQEFRVEALIAAIAERW
jgi:hypothetical protein